MENRSNAGQWEPIQHRFHYLPVHVALLHTGKVLAFGGSGNDEHNLHTPYPAEIFDPATGEVRSIDQRLPGDVFCSGHAFLPDGRLLVAGGTRLYDGHFLIQGFPPFRGSDQAYLFDPGSERWSRAEDMQNGRWYPTLVGLPDGRILAMAGLTKHVPWVFLRELEVYTPGRGWSVLRRAARWMPLYPRLHLLPNGTVFYAGSYNTHYTFPFTLRGFPTATFSPRTQRWRRIGSPNQSEREEGISVLLPLRPPDYRPRVLLAGGGTPGGKKATAEAEMIDLSARIPRWQRIDPMAHERYYAYPVILPTGMVLVLGGRSGAAAPHAMSPGGPGMKHVGMGDEPEPAITGDPLAVHVPELFDPESTSWSALAPMSADRLYHSNALLLPDGRVMMAGSNPGRRVNELRIEIFDPPYLFGDRRPRIDRAPYGVGYGTEFEIDTRDAEEIDEVCLIRPGATTHCVDTEQRFVGLVIRHRAAGRVSVSSPSSPEVAPPGYYMLFVLRQGVPSEATFMHLGAATRPTGRRMEMTIGAAKEQLMSDDERAEANRKTVETLKAVQAGIETTTSVQLDRVQVTTAKTFRALGRMIWITFAFGLALTVSSLLLFIFYQRTLEVLGLGTLGVADWLALFFYKPMDRLQKANADFAQQLIILKSWVLSVNLQLLAMRVNDPPTVIEAAKNVQAATVESAESIQRFIEARENS